MRLALDLRPLLETEPGGVGSYTRALWEALGELRGQEVVPVVTGRGKLAWVQPIGLVRFGLPNPITNVSLSLFRWPKLDLLAGVERFLLPNWNFLSLDRRTELTLVVHDLSFERNPHWYSPKQRLWHRAVRPRRLAARADRIIAVSEWTKQDLMEKYGLEEEKIYIVHPVPDRAPAELPFPVALPERFVLFLGAVEERKNPLSLLQAFELIAEKHPDVHLIVAGKHGYGSEKVREKAKRSQFASRIRVMGYVPVPVRRALYRKATVFAYPSFYEGFGIPLLEAMGEGKPVVAGMKSAMPEVVADAGILVDPYDVSQLALALDEILASESFARTLGGKAKARAATFPDSMVPGLRPLFG